MQAGDVKLGKVFANDHVSIVPLFQRPYVWDKDRNWRPLWLDVQRAAEEIHAERAEGFTKQNPTSYFLGAVVVQQRHTPPQRLDASHVIDGQQRMTTLQVLFASARSIAAGLGQDKTAARFAAMVENRPETVHDDYPDDRFKVWPLPQDRAAFLWAVRRPDDATPPPDAAHRLVRARAWFEKAIADWLDKVEDQGEGLEDLLYAIQDRMQLVQINLGPSDHPQVIFEALNHRGVQLAAADLVKNRLFYAVEHQGDGKLAEALLLNYWLPLDGEDWRAQVTTGRIKRAYVDLLLAYWLTIQKSEEVLVDQLFTDFTEWFVGTDARATAVIKDIRRYADAYDRLYDLPRADPTGRLVESMRATAVTTPWPVLLYLKVRTEIPAEQEWRAAEAIESFLMRRGVAGLTSSDYNRLFVQVLKEAQAAEPEAAGDTVVDCLLSQTAESRNWPTDEEFRDSLLAEGLYERMYRARLKALLVGIENHLRDGKTVTEGTLSPRNGKLNIEHVLPQKWRENWPLPPESADEAEERRQSAKHRLGNLTLATTKLNPSMSNKGWLKKKPVLQTHSLVRITTASILSAPEPMADDWTDVDWASDWDETRIALRGRWLADLALQVWPQPAPS